MKKEHLLFGQWNSASKKWTSVYSITALLLQKKWPGIQIYQESRIHVMHLQFQILTRPHSNFITFSLTRAIQDLPYHFNIADYVPIGELIFCNNCT